MTAPAPQSPIQHESEERDPAFERVIFFSDGIFAIAITLLTLEVRLPHIEPANVSTELTGAVIGLLPQISVFALSYVVIAVYWIAHHRVFRQIQRYDYRLVWLNLLFLFFIAFLPVPTAVLGEYWDQPASNVFYALSIGLVGVTEFLLWRYAVTRQMIDPKIPPRAVEYFGLRVLVPPAVFLLSIPLVWIAPDYGKLSWLLIIVVGQILQRRYPAEHRLRQHEL